MTAPGSVARSGSSGSSGSGISVALLVLPAEQPDAGPPARVIPLVMRASVAGADDVSLIRLEVSGPGLDAPISAELPVENGAASGTVEVPAGPARVFSLHALAAGGGAYAGQAAADVRAGSAALLTVALAPNGNGRRQR